MDITSLLSKPIIFLSFSKWNGKKVYRSGTSLSGDISWTCYQAICVINWKTSKQNTKANTLSPPATKYNINHSWIREFLPIAFAIFFHFASNMKVELRATQESLRNKWLTFTKIQYLCSLCTLFFLCKRWLCRFPVYINQ